MIELVPRLAEAEAIMTSAILLREVALTRLQKEWILFALAAARRDWYGQARHSAWLLDRGVSRDRLNGVYSDYRSSGLGESDVELIGFALRLATLPAALPGHLPDSLRRAGLTDSHVLDVVLIASWSAYLHVVSAGLFACNSANPELTGHTESTPTEVPASNGSPAYPPQASDENGPANEREVRFALHRVEEQFGYIPNVFRAEASRPDVIDAQLRAAHLWLFAEGSLSRMQKESLFLAVAASNLNSYCVAMHCEMLRRMGVSREEAGRIAIDHHAANLVEPDKILLDVCLRLSRRPGSFRREDVSALTRAGFSEVQVHEAVVITAITHMFNTLDTGLGVEPDFEVGFPLQPHVPDHRPLDTAQDPDLPLVLRVKAGDTDAFEDLVRRHGRRLHRTLAAIVGQEADLDDVVQEALVKAFQHIGEFEGRARFSSWLTRIAVNAGLQRIRARRGMVSLDEDVSLNGEFVPRQVEAWQDNPEQSYSKSELRRIVMTAVMRLPEHYRIVVMLRDLQELSTEETAASLGLTIANVKSRLFRGRLMLREALSAHFSSHAQECKSC